MVDDDVCCRGLGVENSVELVEDEVVLLLLLVVEENENEDFAGLGALPLLDEEVKENAGFVAAEVALEVNVTLPNGLVGLAAAGGGRVVVAKGLEEEEEAAAFCCCCCNGGADDAFAPADPPPPLPNFRLYNRINNINI